MADYRPVKSAERTVRILEVMAASPVMLTLQELRERLGYPRSSLYALVRTLRDLGWVESDASGARFGVGPDALRSGSAYLERDPALPYAAASLESLARELGRTVHYGRRDGATVMYLASREAAHDVPCRYRVGRKLPVHVCALGHALLAELTDAEVADLLPERLERYTAATHTRRDALHRALEGVRERGWAAEREQGSAQVACVAVAVPYRIPATDAVSCSMPVELFDRRGEPERVGDALSAHARRLGDTLRRAGVR